MVVQNTLAYALATDSQYVRQQFCLRCAVSAADAAQLPSIVTVQALLPECLKHMRSSSHVYNA